MVTFGMLFIALGLFLIFRPMVWCRLNRPEEEKTKNPAADTLRGARRQGFVFVLGGLALLFVQLFKN